MLDNSYLLLILLAAELADISVNLRPTVTPAKLCYVENPGCHQCDLSHCCTVCYQGYNLDEYMCKTDTTMPWPGKPYYYRRYIHAIMSSIKLYIIIYSLMTTCMALF